MKTIKGIQIIIVGFLILLLTTTASCMPSIPEMPEITPPNIPIPTPPPGLPQKPPEPEEEIVPVGTPVKVSFEVALPQTSEPVTLNLNGDEIELNSTTDYLFSSSEIDVKAGDILEYYFSSGDNKTENISLSVERGGKIRDGLPWLSSEKYQKTGFIKGHTVMDAGGFIINSFRRGDISSTCNAMKADGAEWFSYDYYWAYDDAKKPSIVNQIDYSPLGAMLDQDFKSMADAAREQDLKILLLTELKWIIPAEVRESYDNWDEYMEYQNSVWTEGGNLLSEMSAKLAENPDDPEANAYWDR